MPNLTEQAVRRQPAWLRALTTDDRLPSASRIVHTGCGTSFHAAQTGGRAVHAFEAALAPPDADVMVCVSHEGETELSLAAVEAFRGEVWLVTGAPRSPIAARADRVVVCTPEIEKSWCHTASYTCAVAAIQLLHGRDISGAAERVERALVHEPTLPAKERILVVGAGPDWPTAQEAALKIREGAQVDAVAHHTEQILHGYLAALPAGTTAYVIRGPSELSAVRTSKLVEVLEALGCQIVIVAGGDPISGIVYFQLLTLALAARRGVDPDSIGRAAGTALARAVGAYPSADAGELRPPEQAA